MRLRIARILHGAAYALSREFRATHCEREIDALASRIAADAFRGVLLSRREALNALEALSHFEGVRFSAYGGPVAFGPEAGARLGMAKAFCNDALRDSR